MLSLRYISHSKIINENAKALTGLGQASINIPSRTNIPCQIKNAASAGMYLAVQENIVSPIAAPL
jgi:hypothetical protein